MANNHSDAYAERMLLTGLLNYGSDAYYIIDEHVQTNDFSIKENKYIYSIFKDLITTHSLEKPTISELVTLLQKNYPEADEEYDFHTYLTALSYDKINKDTLQMFCKSVKKLAIARNLKIKLEEAAKRLDSVDGSQSVAEIISLAEQPINEFVGQILKVNDVSNLSDEINDYIQWLASERPENKGIPSGFPRWDIAIGGGLRKPGVHLVGARAKVGKSFLCVNIAKKLAEKSIPVLYLDSELTKEITLSRLTASISDITIDMVESGAFADDMKLSQQINRVPLVLKDKKVSYQNISGLSHDQWLSTMRRWLMKDVGFHPTGEAKDCLIILDYIKTMDITALKNITEWQYLGQVITDLHNFCIRYNVPILSLVQLNRDGISNDHQGVIAGSDRLMGLCSSFSIMRKKEADDFASDPLTDINGNPILTSGDRKMVVVDCRFGSGLDDGEYINIRTDLSKGQMDEGHTNVENRLATTQSSNTAVVRTPPPKTQPPVVNKQKEEEEEDDDAIPPF